MNNEHCDLIKKELSKLKDPFKAEDIEWRIGRCGKAQNGVWATCLAYISARAAQDRLDEVVGPENWNVGYEECSSLTNKGVIAHLSIRVNGEWITKIDGSEQSEMDPFKGGLSGAFKRVASVWGIGRYLYGLTEGFAQIVDKGTEGARYGKTKEGEVFYWIPPELPDWALPKKPEDEEEIISLEILQQKLDEQVDLALKDIRDLTEDIGKEQITVVNPAPWTPKTDAVKKNISPTKGSQSPAAKVSKPMADFNLNDPGEYIIKQKKYKGMTLGEVGKNKLESYVAFIRDLADQKNEPVGKGIEELEAAMRLKWPKDKPKTNEDAEPPITSYDEDIPF